MVNCKNCGAPLSLDNAFCPHCGSANPEAQEHLKKLEKLNRDYKKTKSEVISEVKKNKSGYGVLTILIIVLLSNLALIPMHHNSWSIADSIVSRQKNKNEVKELLNTYLNQKDYERFTVTYDKYSASYKDYSEYNRIHYLADTYVKTKSEIINYYHGVDLYTDSLVRACQYIKDYKDDYERYAKRNENTVELKALNDDFDLFMKTFLNLEQEDLDNIYNMSESEILLLVSKRLNNEE